MVFSLEYKLEGEYWIDGIVASSTWDWSNNLIKWFFEEDERNITGSGDYYKLIAGNSHTGYLISDEKADRTLNYICEYQGLCLSYPYENGSCCFSLSQS